MLDKVTIIIPAYNEEKTIADVINKVRESEIKSEIIVVDNCSTDNTAKIAIDCNVKVLSCNQKGKGYAMEDGLNEATGDIIAFIDGDLKIYNNDLIKQIIEPIIKENVDFIKTVFKRKGGRVTELVAIPLLELLFPNIYQFKQPLSGVIAGKRYVFESLKFEKDYGVDIGILLDVIANEFKIKEVDILKIDNCSQSWKSLSKMSKEVARAILSRANKNV